MDAHEETITDPQAERARLQGEALQAWYARDGRQRTPEEWEAEWKRQAELLKGPARGVVFTYLFLATAWNLLFPVFGAAFAGIAGVWLVIGSGNLWVRVAITAVLTLIWGTRGAPYVAYLLLILFLTSSLGYVAALIASRRSAMPVRLLQFSIWEIGGCTMALAAGMAMLRGAGFDLKYFEDDTIHAVLYVSSAFLIAVNVLLVCWPMLIPQRYRTRTLFLCSAFAMLIVMPFLETLVLGFFEVNVRSTWESPLYFVLDPRADSKPATDFVVPLSWIGALLGWLLVYMLEGAGAFHDVDVKKLTTPAEGPLD